MTSYPELDIPHSSQGILDLDLPCLPMVTVTHGDCLDVMRGMADASVDSIVTDPPYGLGFMGKAWDDLPPGREWAEECLRVLKPGGHLLAFGGSRTWHRLAVAVEDAGFEIRDSIAWLYGSGFPKSLDVGKAIDKQRDDTPARRAVGAWLRAQRERAGLQQKAVAAYWPSATGGLTGCVANWEGGFNCPTWGQWADLKRIVGFPDDMDAEVWRLNGRKGTPGEAWATADVLRTDDRMNEPNGVVNIGQGERTPVTRQIKAPATDSARQWHGWGTALKPAFEPVVCAQKPFNAVPLGSEANRLHHLIGALLWLSLSPARRAQLSSQSSPAAHGAAWCASALASAATAISPGVSAGTATYSSQALASTFSNIVSSWSSILAALSDPTSMSTTSTRSSTTTGLRTLNLLLAPLTSQSTMPRCACLTSGPRSNAPSADTASTDEWAKWLHTLSASVPASAIEGIALVAASALAPLAESFSDDRAAGSFADSTATTGAASSGSPAFEPIVVARKPLIGTVASNVLAFGTGGLNIDGCRIGTTVETWPKSRSFSSGISSGYTNGIEKGPTQYTGAAPAGRWPANVALDGCQSDALDEQSGASRFFPTFRYQAKAPTSERPKVNGVAHPTVKPLELMRWLVRLVTPPGGTVLDPFAGSGATVEACMLEGCDCIAVEREAEYLPLIHARIARVADPA